ncbi:MAG TPA: hypothetical protein VGR57_03365, partial [Ktedonobacterales bacterium]|nr:hypothetical protein [Ktedonobacterales bacterium]
EQGDFDGLALSALGGGVALRDDPDDSAYTNQTARQIVAAEFAKRASYLALDGDQSQVFPANPATTLSPVYDGRNLEEILHDLCFSLGDYTWTVYDHPVHRDPAGYPTWQLAAHPRDTSTVGYVALGEDVLDWRVTPSQQRAYNVVQILYVDATNGPASVTVSDPRLGAGGTQNLAPFRRRKLRRNLGASPLTASQATTIANAWLAAYQSITHKVELTLRAVRDARGVVIPLHQVRSDANLFVPELAVRGGATYGQQALAGSATAGVNLFWITETRYRETAQGDLTLTIQADSYSDHQGKLLGQLAIAREAALRSRGAYRNVASPGAVETGACGLQMSNQSAGATVSVVINFKQVLAQAPTSITLAPTSQSNVSSVGAANLSVYGFTLNVVVNAAGNVAWVGTYQTVGN